MRYDLARMVRRSRKTRRTEIVIPRIIPTQAQAGAYARILAVLPQAWAAKVRDRILPAYERSIAERALTRDAMTRDDARDLGEEVQASSDELDALVLTLTPKMRNWSLTVDKWHAATWAAKLKAATGVDATAIVGALGAEETLSAFYQRNVGLITSIDAELERRIGAVIWAGYEALEPRDTIARKLDEAVDLGRARARRIAVDQTTKLSAGLDQQRQRDAGIKVYKWRHSHKLHPRQEHVVRDGKLFSWDAPPADGPPGTLPFCGCHAEAVLDLTVPASQQESGAVAA